MILLFIYCIFPLLILFRIPLFFFDSFIHYILVSFVLYFLFRILSHSFLFSWFLLIDTLTFCFPDFLIFFFYLYVFVKFTWVYYFALIWSRISRLILFSFFYVSWCSRFQIVCVRKHTTLHLGIYTIRLRCVLTRGLHLPGMSQKKPDLRRPFILLYGTGNIVI